MHFLIVFCVGVAIFASTAVSAETARCPLSGRDDCGDLGSQQLDEELAALLAAPSEWIDRMPAQLRDNARAALKEAQNEWIKFRDAECRRQLTWSYMTAMGERGFLASCANGMTFHRRDDLWSSINLGHGDDDEIPCRQIAHLVALSKDVAKRLMRDAGLPIVPFVAMSGSSPITYHDAVRAMSVHPPTPDVSLRRSEPTRRAIS